MARIDPSLAESKSTERNTQFVCRVNICNKKTYNKVDTSAKCVNMSHYCNMH